MIIVYANEQAHSFIALVNDFSSHMNKRYRGVLMTATNILIWEYVVYFLLGMGSRITM